MSLRAQAAEVVVPPDDPFANDRLERKDSIVGLTGVVGQIEGPCVMAVDAGWGMGKTTFLRMWAQHLRNEQFLVVEFNAWQTDFTWDPFFALWSELMMQLGWPSDGDYSPVLDDRARSLIQVLRRGSLVAGTALSAVGQPELASAVAAGSEFLRDIDNGSESAAEEVEQTPFAEASYRQAKDLIDEFRTTLGGSARSLADANGGRPLVILVDELDRCRPNYAIELLETAKHFLSVDHIVFVLCLDRLQLGHSVRAIYGSDFNSDGYLRRFFDIDLRLPEPSRSAFLNAIGKDLQIAEQLQLLASNGRIYSRIDDPASLRFVVNVLDASPLSLRDLQQTLNRLSLLLASVREDHFLYLETVVVLLVLRMLDSELYRRVLAGNGKDEEAIAAFGLRKSDRRDSRVTVRATVEAVLSASVCLASADASGRPQEEMLPVLMQHRRTNEVTEGEHTVSGGERTMAMLVVGYVSRFCGRHDLDEEWDFTRVNDRLGFSGAVRCLELFPE